MKRIALILSIIGLVGATATVSLADQGCLLSWLQNGDRLCVSEHGNVNFLGPKKTNLPVPDAPNTNHREGYALCYADKEQAFESTDFGDDSLSFGFGPPATSSEPGGILHVARSSAYGQLLLTQSFYPDIHKRQVRVVMTVTNTTHKTLFHIKLFRGVAVAERGARASYTKRSAMSLRPGQSHGMMLTDVTWPPRSGTKTGRASAETLGCDPRADGRGTAGYVKIPIGSLSPGQSRTVEVFYRSF